VTASGSPGKLGLLSQAISRTTAIYPGNPRFLPTIAAILRMTTLLESFESLIRPLVKFPSLRVQRSNP
jgi:hypothetical protein